MQLLNTNIKDLQATVDSTLPELIALSATAGIVLIVLLIFRIKFYPSAPIVSILALLLFNDLFQILFNLPTYFASNVNAACLISTIGTTFFRLAANYWLIFITRLIYRQKFAPGKQIDLTRHLSKHIFLTYMPSIMVSLILLVVSGFFGTDSQFSCYRDIKNKTVSDYLIYISSFILPNFVALVFLVYYLVLYTKLWPKSHSLFLVFPIVAIPFIIYEQILKIYLFVVEQTATKGMQVPLIIEPLSHAVIFIIVLKNINKTRAQEEEITLKDDSNKQSFIAQAP